MIKNLTLSSTILRILIFFNLGLPALIPSTENLPKSTAQIQSDTAKDSIAAIHHQTKSPLFPITHPNGKNSSMLGDFIEHVTDASIILFAIFIIWGLIMRVQSNTNENLVFTLTLLGILALNIYLIDHFKQVIWGYWVVYTLAMNLFIFEIILLINRPQKRKFS